MTTGQEPSLSSGNKPPADTSQSPGLRDEYAVLEVILTLSHANPVEREAALELLLEMGEKAIPALMRAAREPDRDSKLAAAHAMSLLGHEEFRPVLLDLLEHPDEWIQHTAFDALMVHGGLPLDIVERDLPAYTARRIIALFETRAGREQLRELAHEHPAERVIPALVRTSLPVLEQATWLTEATNAVYRELALLFNNVYPDTFTVCLSLLEESQSPSFIQGLFYILHHQNLAEAQQRLFVGHVIAQWEHTDDVSTIVGEVLRRWGTEAQAMRLYDLLRNQDATDSALIRDVLYVVYNRGSESEAHRLYRRVIRRARWGSWLRTGDNQLEVMRMLGMDIRDWWYYGG